MEQTPSQESQLFWEKDLARADLDVRIVVFLNPLQQSLFQQWDRTLPRLNFCCGAQTTVLLMTFKAVCVEKKGHVKPL